MANSHAQPNPAPVETAAQTALAAAPEETLPEAHAPKPEGRLAAFRRRLPHFSDETQKKAGKNLVRFLVLVLVLTLVAKGTTAATLPLVETSRAEAGEIVQRVRGTGTVKASGSLTLEVPEGLTIQQVLASAGQSVNAGDVLAQFDLDELKEQLQRQTNELNKLRLELQQLQSGNTHDASALESARRTLERAQQDYDTAKAQADADVAAARQALADAEAAAQQALDALNAISDPGAPEYQPAHDDWAAKNAEVAAKQQALAQAQSDTDATLLPLARALEDARTALAKAQQDDADALQKERETSAQNSLDASGKQLDIDAQTDKVNRLQSLLDSGGQLRAETNGVVQELPQPGAKTGDGAAFRMADTSGGYEAEMWVDKKDAEKLSVGDLCEVVMSGGSMYYRPTAEGTVITVGAAGEDGRAKVTVRLPGEDWKSGQTVDAQILQDRQSHALCVPLSAIHASNDGYYILVLQQQNTVLGLETIAAKIPVTIKAQDDQYAAIEGPIGERDQIITASNKAVQPDDKVRVEP